jgi:MerR family transcriptional regulator, copper efflux regulator
MCCMRISDLARSAGVTTKTVRFYEKAGLLDEPGRTASGYRDYPAEAVARLRFIRAAQAAGLTLAEIHDVLEVRDSGQPPCRNVTALLKAHLDQVEQRINELEHARTTLRDLHTRAAATDPAKCHTDRMCSILDTTPREPVSLRAPFATRLA